MSGHRSPWVRRSAALAMLALAVAACGGGGSKGHDTDAGAKGDRSTTTSTGPGGDGWSATDGSSSSGTDPATGGVSSAETTPLALTGNEPNEHGAPLPGSYFYDITGADLPAELSVRDLLDDQDADHFDRTGDLGQLHIEKEKAEARASLLRWKASGLFLDAEQRAQNTTSGMQEGAVCDYKPDLLLQPTKLTVGATWDDESTCSAHQGDVTINRKRSVRGEVMAASTAQVDGKTVQTVRIKRVTDTTTTSDTEPPLLITEHREVTIEWIVGLGLAAHIEGTVVETISGAPKAPRTYTWTLRSTKRSG